jgi:hypothetical protein
MRISVPASVMVREAGGESVILNLESGRYFGLNPMGARMVAVLSESESIQAASETLLREYDVDPGRLQQDLDNLIQQLLEHGLIEVSGG